MDDYQKKIDRINFLNKEIADLKQVIMLMIDQAGSPFPTVACRTVIATGREALKGKKNAV